VFEGHHMCTIISRVRGIVSQAMSKESASASSTTMYDMLVSVLALALAAYVVAGVLRKQRVHEIVLSADRSRLLNAGKLPSYFKYKESLLMPVRNQGHCASCWAFATSDTIADTLNLRSGGKWPHGPLAPQYLLSCTKLHYGCELGGSPEDVYSSREAAVVGIPLEKDMPYQEKVTDCSALPADAIRVRTVPNTGVDICADPAFALPGFRQKTINENIVNMKKSLLQFGPILGTLAITRSLYDYKANSIYKSLPNEPVLGAHAIEIFGWSDAGANTAEPGFDGAFWHVRNSYSSRWSGALQGFAYIAMGSNESQIESRASICQIEVPDYLKQAVADHDIWTSAYTSYSEYSSDPHKQNFKEIDPERDAFLERLDVQRGQTAHHHGGLVAANT
jgi:cathepsin B